MIRFCIKFILLYGVEDDMAVKDIKQHIWDIKLKELGCRTKQMSWLKNIQHKF